MEHNYPFNAYQMWTYRVVMMVDCIGFAVVWLVWDPHFGLSLVSFVAFYEVGDFDMDPRQEGVWGAIEVEKVQKWRAAKQGCIACRSGASLNNSAIKHCCKRTTNYDI